MVRPRRSPSFAADFGRASPSCHCNRHADAFQAVMQGRSTPSCQRKLASILTLALPFQEQHGCQLSLA